MYIFIAVMLGKQKFLESIQHEKYVWKERIQLCGKYRKLQAKRISVAADTYNDALANVYESFSEMIEKFSCSSSN